MNLSNNLCTHCTHHYWIARLYHFARVYPAKYSRNDTIRGYFFCARSPDFLGFFRL